MLPESLSTALAIPQRGPGAPGHRHRDRDRRRRYGSRSPTSTALVVMNRAELAYNGIAGALDGTAPPPPIGWQRFRAGRATPYPGRGRPGDEELRHQHGVYWRHWRRGPDRWGCYQVALLDGRRSPGPKSFRRFMIRRRRRPGISKCKGCHCCAGPALARSLVEIVELAALQAPAAKAERPRLGQLDQHQVDPTVSYLSLSGAEALWFRRVRRRASRTWTNISGFEPIGGSHGYFQDDRNQGIFCTEFR